MDSGIRWQTVCGRRDTVYSDDMGTIRNTDCENIDAELSRLCSEAIEIETRKDEYSEDFIVWVTVNEELHSIRVTVDEYRDGSWSANVRLAIAELSAQQ